MSSRTRPTRRWRADGLRARPLTDLFAEAGRNAAATAELLDDLLATWPDGAGLVDRIHGHEHEGDRITHDIAQLLNRTYAASVDRGDALALAAAIDDVVDYADEAADFLAIYRIEAPMAQAQALAGVLRDATRALSDALAELRRPARLPPYVVEVNRLENEGDRLLRDGLAALFDRGIDPMVVIRWKDVLDRIEAAIDACEQASHVLEGIAVKST